MAELIYRVVIEKGAFRVTDDHSVCKEADVILVDVQTPTDGNHVPHYDSLCDVDPVRCAKVGFVVRAVGKGT